MAEDREVPIGQLAKKVSFLYPDRIDTNDHNPDVTVEAVRRISNAAYRFNHLAITEYGGRSGPERERGLVENSIGAAFQTFEGEEIHPDSFDKAAVILRGIIQGHPFNDGNKRTGFLTTVYVLEQFGFTVPDHLPQDDVVAFCVRVSAGEIRDVGTISRQLRDYWLPQGTH